MIVLLVSNYRNRRKKEDTGKKKIFFIISSNHTHLFSAMNAEIHPDRGIHGEIDRLMMKE